MKKIIIFGNGLGMALDPEHFSLSNALKDVWERPNFLNERQKKLIEKCTSSTGAPEAEDQLGTLHEVVTYCKALNNISGGNKDGWLSDNGFSFPEITSKYIHKVATRLHNYTGSLPIEFEENLIKFVRETKSHVATLNYDKLLYQSFIRNKILKGYCGDLVDGILNNGFQYENLERKYDRIFGYYLHLHGSPLFVSEHKVIKKLHLTDLTLEKDYVSEHIVLTHIQKKPSVISASKLLSAYWEYLQFALSESTEIILFGYSGLDEHLNQLITPYLKKIKLRIVEWNGSGDPQQRNEYWRKKFRIENKNQIKVCLLDNITDFIDW